MAVKSIVLIILVAAIVTTVTMNNVYAVVDECNGHEIEATIKSEIVNNKIQSSLIIKVDKAQEYKVGDEITLDNIKYKVLAYEKPSNISGTDGNDFIVGTVGPNRINGKGGNDFIVGFGGKDTLIGGSGDDIICGGNGPDTIYGDGYIVTNKKLDKVHGGNDKLFGGNSSDIIHGDYIVINKKAEVNGVTGGNDIIDGGATAVGQQKLYGDSIVANGKVIIILGGNDTLRTAGPGPIYGDFIKGSKDQNDITGGNDKLLGSNDNNIPLVGDYIEGRGGNDTLKGGNDSIDGKGGNDQLIGDEIYSHSKKNANADGNVTGGNDIINAKDGVKDNVDGDLLQAKRVTKGKDICSIDKNIDINVNCEHENLKGLVKINGKDLDGIEQDMLKKKIQINQNQKMPITFKLNNSIGPVKITSIALTTPTNNRCIFENNLPITVPIGGELKFTYPDDFMGKNNCNVAGMYMLEIATEVGDPIVTEFAVSFQVLNESIIGIVGLVGVSIAILMLYRRQKTY